MKLVSRLLHIAGLFCLLISSASAAPAIIERVGKRWSAYGDYLHAFRLTNTSEATISYVGYGPSSPLYTMQFRKFGWKGERRFDCGVGLGSHQLRTHQSTTFTLLPPDGRRAWRIGLELQIGNQSEPQLLWTKALATDSALDQATPSAAKLVLHKIVHQPGRDFPYTFTITNISQQPLFYGGYQESNSPPLCMTAERHWGRWIDTGHVDWSGTNFGFKKLSPGSPS